MATKETVTKFMQDKKFPLQPYDAEKCWAMWNDEKTGGPGHVGPKPEKLPTDATKLAIYLAQNYDHNKPLPGDKNIPPAKVVKIKTDDEEEEDFKE